ILRSTKIVATLGPASSDPAVLESMIRAGVDVVRLNFSHGTAEDHRKRAELVKEIARKTARPGGTSAHLHGPRAATGIAAKLEVGYCALSFPKWGPNMYMAGELLRASGGKAFLIAKIERAEAV